MAKVVPFIHPETLKRLEREGVIHDQFCRCRACKPPLVGEQSLEWTRRLEIALMIAIAIVVTILVVVAS